MFLKKIDNKIKVIFSLSILSVVLSLILVIFPSFNKKGVPINNEPDPSVLGYTRIPQIFISGGDGGYGQGGIIPLSSFAEPAVDIISYSISGKADVSLYDANSDAVFNYLLHDKENKQLKKITNIDNFKLITSFKHEIVKGDGESSKLVLPLSEKGIYFLRIKLGSVTADSFIIRSGVGVFLAEGDNEYIVWGQDLKTRRSLDSGDIKIYSLLDSKKEISSTLLNKEGIAKVKITADGDVLFFERNNDVAIVPINLQYLNYSYSYNRFKPRDKRMKYFIFTDRPLYKPGDTVYFKSILRDDDDAKYTIPSGNATVKVYKDYDDKNSFFESKYPISNEGTVFGEVKIPKDSPTGFYQLKVEMPTPPGSKDNNYYYYSTASFQVQFYRKPEYFVDVSTPKTDYISQDKASFMISGEYFSGQPLSNEKVKYKITSADYYEYDYYSDNLVNLSDDYRYGWWYGESNIKEGEATLNQKGEAEVEFLAKIPDNKKSNQIFSIEVNFEKKGQEPAFARKNILVYAGEFGIFRKDYNHYSTTVGKGAELPLILVPYRTSSVNNILLSGKVTRENWISYQEPDKKYPSYKKEVENLPDISGTTNSKGEVTLKFTPKKQGSYKISVSGKDSRGNVVYKEFYYWVSDRDQPFYQEGDNNLTIKTDREKYEPSEKAFLTISSSIPNRDIFLSFERGFVKRYEIIHLNGKVTSLEAPLSKSDIPNIYASVNSFSDNDLDRNTINIPVSAEGKRVKVSIIPNKKIYGPSEEVTLNIETTDIEGNPVSAESAVWAIDKALLSLTDQKLENIFDKFWSERADETTIAHSFEGITSFMAEMGGCFSSDTKILMSDGKSKPIKDVKIGEMVLTREKNSKQLVKGRVENVHKAEVSGYLIINGNLKLTPNHIIFVNGDFKEAGFAQIGDKLIDSSGKEVKVYSIEYLSGKFPVYNLSIEKYQTFFAENIWVHNQKGGQNRIAFKDTAYWNPKAMTGPLGRAKLTFKLPDNLTTWVISAVSSTEDTRVGQSSEEITVSKGVIVRPILPNILRVGDEIVLSATVSNLSEIDQKFDISLSFEGGEIENPDYEGVLIKSKEIYQAYWKIKVNKESEKAKIEFSAKSIDDKNLSDTVVLGIPIWTFGFSERMAETGIGQKQYLVKLASDATTDKSFVTLSLTPTLLGTITPSFKYLIDYPYGCTEQTTSRFVPSVIAKLNPLLFSSILADKNINDIIDSGIKRLAKLQHGDGGWSWWSSGNSNPFVSSYVIEYILMAKKSGTSVDNQIIDKALGYFKSLDDKTISKEDLISKTYALTLLDYKERRKSINDFSGLTPDFLSLAVLSNILNGDRNISTNGLSILSQQAKTQGDEVFWETGKKINFGSVVSSTSFSIRAILLGGGNRDLATKAILYLTRSRKYDYWTNTFATAQAIRAITEFSKSENELKPKYKYTVTLDGKTIDLGAVSDPFQVILDINIPISKIKKEGSNLEVSFTGDGQLYSTLVIKEFHTDNKAEAQSNGLTVKKEFKNEKGEEYSLAVGDIINVIISVSGLSAGENYGVISDELPSGLVPINTSFKNEEFNQNWNDYYNNGYDTEYTQNGVILSPYYVKPGENIYTYKARVISEGTFQTPPAVSSLMYSPEIYGRSSALTIKTTGNSKIVGVRKNSKPQGDKLIFDYKQIYIFGGVFLLILLLIFGIVKGKLLRKNSVLETKEKQEEVKQTPTTNEVEQKNDIQ